MSFQCLQERIWSDIKPKGCGNSAWCEVLLALEKWRWWGLITAFLKIDLLEGTVWAPLKQLSPNTCLHLQITLNVHRLDWQASQAKHYKSGSRVYIVIMQVHTGPRVFLRSLKKFWFLSITKPARKYMENKGVIELRSSKQERVACDSHHLLLYKDWLPSKNTALLCTSGTLECFFPIASPTISHLNKWKKVFSLGFTAGMIVVSKNAFAILGCQGLVLDFSIKSVSGSVNQNATVAYRRTPPWHPHE